MIYMDNAATTRITPRVRAAMAPYLDDVFGNPMSLHTAGRAARNAIERAREQCAHALNCRPEEVHFTGGGTESDNWALRAAASAFRERGSHIITTSIEHPAVRNTCAYLEREGFEVTSLPVSSSGIVDADLLRAAIREDTILISVMAANNEIGTLQPIQEIGNIAKERSICFHTDAVQAVGAVPLDLNTLNVDMLSLSGHKLHAPKGIGALFVRKGVGIGPLLYGGGQEAGLRPGTENLTGIVGLGEAMQTAADTLNDRMEYITGLRNHLIDRVLEEIPQAILNGDRTHRLPGNCNFSFPGVESTELVMALDMMDICASAGSACSAGAVEPSHVLLALCGEDRARAASAIRFSMNEENTMEEVDRVADALGKVVADLRALNA